MHERRRRDSSGREPEFNPMLHESTPQVVGYDTRSSPVTLEALAVELHRLKSVHGVWMKQKDEELHELRTKVDVQERELLQKAAELRGIGGRGGLFFRQENRRLNSGSSSSSDDAERKKLWPPSFDCIVLVVVLIFTIIQLTIPAAPAPPPPPPQFLRTSSGLVLNTAPPKPKIRPSESHPPKAIALFDTKDPAIQMRHRCLSEIRKRHDEFYKSVFPPGQVLLVDPAYHSNVGDHMLTLGEHEFIKRMGLKPPLECDYVQAGGFVKPCNDLLWMPLAKDITVAMWHAGGNWGDIWRTAQEPRVSSFRKLLKQNLTVISMPQSLHYKSTVLEIRDAEKIREGVFDGIGADMFNTDRSTVAKKVAFAWREKESFEKGSKLYPFVNNVIVPDIAFQLGPYKAMPPTAANLKKVDLLIFLRKDHESNIGYLGGATFINEAIKKVGKPGITHRVVDWGDRLSIFNSNDIFFSDTSIQLLSLGRVVICDRLHAAILAYLVGLPFVFIDQKTGKITKTLRVAFESSDDCKDGGKARWAKALNLESGIKKAIDFLDRYDLRKEESNSFTSSWFKTK